MFFPAENGKDYILGGCSLSKYWLYVYFINIKFGRYGERVVFINESIEFEFSCFYLVDDLVYVDWEIELIINNGRPVYVNVAEYNFDINRCKFIGK